MSRSAPMVNAFNAGEFSPALEGRTDLAKYPHACKLIENFLLLSQGPAQRRGGSRYVAPVKNESNRGWLVRFEFNATQAFILEFGDLYVRFYTDHGYVLNVGVPYEIVSPYAIADLTNADGSCALQFVQSGDVVYLAHSSEAVKAYTLTRFANTNWVFAEYAPNQGPFLEENGTTTTVIASATTGAITLTASAATFVATDVGRLVRLQVQNLNVKPWEAGKVYAINDLARFDGKTYKALTAATSGSAPPTHEQGNAFDGQAGVQWAYQDAGYGIARITAFTSNLIVSATVIQDAANGLNQIPADAVANASTRWRLGAWSATSGYPSSVTFFLNRLHWGFGLRWAASVPNDFANMSQDFFGETTIDAAIVEQVQAQDVNAIEWMEGVDRLVIGTGGGEFVVGPQTTNEAYGPGNISIVKQSKQRVRAVQPVLAGNSVVYVQRAGRKLLSLDYVIERDKFASTDLAVLAERITRTGIIATAFQGEPHQIVWCLLGNGKLIGFTYNQEQEVTGWHRHPIGGSGFVESIASIPAPDGNREELWLIVRRTINGATHRYVEYFERPWEGPDQDGTEGDDQADAFYVDSGLTYDGASTTTITGLDHLEGETVQILADGAVQPDKTVSGGAITLTRSASKVQVGLQAIARLVPMRLEGGNPEGTSQGKLSRITDLVIRFVDTLGGKAGLMGRTLDAISFRSPSTLMGSAEAIRSGDFHMTFPGDWERDEFLEIRQEQPLPMTVAALMPNKNSSPT
jgi:hypothetical protein